MSRSNRKNVTWSYTSHLQTRQLLNKRKNFLQQIQHECNHKNASKLSNVQNFFKTSILLLAKEERNGTKCFWYLIWACYAFNFSKCH